MELDKQMEMYKRIDRLANLKGVSLHIVALSIGLNRSSIYSWKRVTPPVKTLIKIADYLDVSLDYILGRSESPDIQYHIEKDVQKDINNILDVFKNQTDFNYEFNGGNIANFNKDEKEIIISSLENTLLLLNFFGNKKKSKKTTIPD